MTGEALGTDPRDADFAEEVLRDLYAYRGKRRWLAWVLWAGLGWAGAHRFYLERPASGLLMFLTGGGMLVWWLFDAFLVEGMVRAHGAEQKRRRESGEPPLELSFMPPLTPGALEKAPAWADRWREDGRARRGLRLAGDAVVLLVAGVSLGAVAAGAGVWEAAVAVVALVAATSAGDAIGRPGRLPGARGLLRWSHRLRLFYHHNRPGNPLALLLRPVTGAVLAPFRRRDRAEVRLYLELGGVFTVGFLLLDLLGALLEDGKELFTLTGLTVLWAEEAALTFVVIYAFATPIGAVLTLHLLMRRTHRVPRLLGVLTLWAVILGVAAG